MNNTTPEKLRTPAGIGKESASLIADAINPVIADAFALYVKTKGFHWHLYGPHFAEYHELFDEQASSILASVDTLAERVRKMGMTTIRSIGDIQDLSQVEDCEDFPSPQEMISELLDDNSAAVRTMRDAMEVCEENGDRATSNVLQSLVDEAEKRVWFLFELTQ